MIGKRWTDEEAALAYRLARRGFKKPKIAQQLGRSVHSVRNFFDYRLARDQRLAMAAMMKRDPIAPNFVLDERDRRNNEPRTVTMDFFGDPAPSRSALGRFCA